MTRPLQDEADLARLLERLSPSLVAVDGGARNGAVELRRLARWLTVHAFEPSAAEYEKLVAAGPSDRHLYSPLALLGRSGDATLYVNKRPGATSTLKPDRRILNHFAPDNWSQMADVVAEVTVSGTTLADYVEQQGIAHIDFLKLDTQGNELDILRGAGASLDRVSVVKTEVGLIPLYEGQPLLGDVATFMADQGFDLIDLQSTDACRRYHVDPGLDPRSYRLVWGDAIFARSLTLDRPRALEQGLVLAELGYVDVALHLFENGAGLAADVRAELSRFYRLRRPPASGSRLKRALFSTMPEPLVSAIRTIRERRPKQVTRVP